MTGCLKWERWRHAEKQRERNRTKQDRHIPLLEKLGVINRKKGQIKKDKEREKKREKGLQLQPSSEETELKKGGEVAGKVCFCFFFLKERGVGES